LVQADDPHPRQSAGNAMQQQRHAGWVPMAGGTLVGGSGCALGAVAGQEEDRLRGRLRQHGVAAQTWRAAVCCKIPGIRSAAAPMWSRTWTTWAW
jgi:hypothetical protein